MHLNYVASFARRLQKIGSSVLLSLPSDWVKANKLTKGHVVFLEINADNSISIFPSNLDLPSVKEVAILYLPNSIDSVINQVYGAYLLGYDVIRLRGKSQISFENRELIKRTTAKLVGLEIVDEDAYNISSQFLLDANTLDAEKILRRMNSIIAGMYRDTLDALRKEEKETEKSIISRDDEVDRQYFLLVRLIRSSMVDQKLARKLNLSNIDILDYRIAANHLESAGDYVSDFASEVHNISRTKFVNAIVEAGKLIEFLQERSVAAFTNKNRSESIEVVKIYNRFIDSMNLIKQLSTKSDFKNSGSAIAVLNAIYSMDRIARCWVDVADLVKPVYLTAPLENV